MNRIFKLLPEIEGEELVHIQQTMKEMDDEEAELFATVYRARRKDPQTVLILCLVGLFVLPGVQRFFLDQIGLGLLYLFTIGLCFIGSIVDLVNYKSLARAYNVKVAKDALILITSN